MCEPSCSCLPVEAGEEVGVVWLQQNQIHKVFDANIRIVGGSDEGGDVLNNSLGLMVSFLDYSNIRIANLISKPHLRKQPPLHKNVLATQLEARTASKKNKPDRFVLKESTPWGFSPVP